MKLIRLTIFFFIIITISSCLKERNDFAGMRTDEGEVVSAIWEQQYLTGDANNIGFGYSIYSSFDFASPATEQVRFFTLHIAQPRKKVAGELKVGISMSAAPGAVLPPAGAIKIPQELIIPAQEGSSIDFPVRFSVTKTNLDPNETYGITFTISSVSQGIASNLEKSVDVYLINSKYEARYDGKSTVSDPNGVYKVDNDKSFVIMEPVAADRFDIHDFYAGTYAVIAANTTTGATTALFNPRYVINPSTGKLLSVLNRSTLANLNATIDPSSGFTYTANDNRVFVAKYKVTLTLNGVARELSFDLKYTWSLPQAF